LDNQVKREKGIFGRKSRLIASQDSIANSPDKKKTHFLASKQSSNLRSSCALPEVQQGKKAPFKDRKVYSYSS